MTSFFSKRFSVSNCYCKIPVNGLSQVWDCTPPPTLPRKNILSACHSMYGIIDLRMKWILIHYIIMFHVTAYILLHKLLHIMHMSTWNYRKHKHVSIDFFYKSKILRLNWKLKWTIEPRSKLSMLCFRLNIILASSKHYFWCQSYILVENLFIRLY